MPFLDVTDVLSDPDFADTVSVLRTATAVDIFGENLATSATTTSAVSAVVTPASSNDLKRLPDTARLEGAITLISTFRFTSGQPGFTADVVTWQGRQYTVMNLDDWSQFGAGFVRATATMLSLS